MCYARTEYQTAEFSRRIRCSLIREHRGNRICIIVARKMARNEIDYDRVREEFYSNVLFVLFVANEEEQSVENLQFYRM